MSSNPTETDPLSLPSVVGTSPVMLGNINALIAKAERERAQERN